MKVNTKQIESKLLEMSNKQHTDFDLFANFLNGLLKNRDFIELEVEDTPKGEEIEEIPYLSDSGGATVDEVNDTREVLNEVIRALNKLHERR